VAIVARLSPRYWDGRRLLRFLAGLALVALSFAGPAQVAVAAPAAPAAAVVESTISTVPVAANDQVVAPAAPVAVAAFQVVPAPVRVEPGSLIDGECQRRFSSRAPPRA